MNERGRGDGLKARRSERHQDKARAGRGDSGELRVIGRGFPLAGETSVGTRIRGRVCQGTAAGMESSQRAEVVRVDERRAAADPKADQR